MPKSRGRRPERSFGTSKAGSGADAMLQSSHRTFSLLSLGYSVVEALGNPWVRGALLTLYYLLIVVGLIVLYGQGDFSTPGFIYQEF